MERWGEKGRKMRVRGKEVRKARGGVDCCSEVYESKSGARAKCKVTSEDAVKWPRRRMRPLRSGRAR